MFGTAAYAQLPYASAPGAEFSVSVSETATGTDTVSAINTFRATLTETASAVESVVGRLIHSSQIAETTTAAETNSAISTFRATLAETASAVESVVCLPTYATRISETATATDAIASVSTVLALVAETTTAADATACIFVFPAAVNETVTATDTAVASLTVPARVSEASTASETFAAKATFSVRVSEQTTAVLNSVVATTTVLASVLESVRAVDEVLGSFLWNDIDDTQIPGWTDILRVATIDEIAVFGGANFGVLAFAGDSVTTYLPAKTAWLEIDDTQIPGWTDILRVATIDEIAVFGGANFGVLAFAGDSVTTYLPAKTPWVEIDDTQLPNWQAIPT
jgi:hypothetical protein